MDRKKKKLINNTSILDIYEYKMYMQTEFISTNLYAKIDNKDLLII